MSELEPDINSEMADNLRTADVNTRVAAAGVLIAHLDIVGCSLERHLVVLFRAFPNEDSTISTAIATLAALKSQREWGERDAMARCKAIAMDRQSSPETIALAQAVFRVLEDRSGPLRAGAPAPAGEDELLRPDHGAGYTDPNMLVRAAGEEIGADGEPPEENGGEAITGEQKPKGWRRIWKR